MELSPLCSILTIYVILGGSNLNSILQHETHPWRCCEYSVVHINPAPLPAPWLCAFPVSILTSCLAGISFFNRPWDTGFSDLDTTFVFVMHHPSGTPKCSHALHDWTISQSWQGCCKLPQHLRPQNRHHRRLCGTSLGHYIRHSGCGDDF